VEFFAYGNAYCDCGAHGCSLTQERVPPLPTLDPLVFKSNNNSIPSFSSYTIQPSESFDLNILQQQCQKLVNKSKDTFWIYANDTASCALESMALSIFHEHVRLNGLDLSSSSLSGAEWWVQYKHVDNAVDDRMINGSIDLHYDKDEYIASTYGIGVFPCISTVTYLAAHNPSIPTIILNNNPSTPVGDPINQCFISFPKLGKHISFNGHLLHGAPIELLPPSTTDIPHIRVTFLVNIWLHHHPSGVLPLSKELIQELDLPMSSLTLSLLPNNIADMDSIKVGKKILRDDSQGSFKTIPFVTESSVWGIDSDQTGLLVKLWLPHMFTPSTIHRSSFQIQYTHDDTAAYLEYEDDNEAEDSFASEFKDMAYCSEIKK
jgi:hypothetical protein